MQNSSFPTYNNIFHVSFSDFDVQKMAESCFLLQKRQKLFISSAISGAIGSLIHQYL